MGNQRFELQVYQDKHGKHPFDDWLAGLRDKKGRGVIQVKLDRLEEGLFNNCKSVGDGVQELKIDFGPGYRVYFALADKYVVLLLCGGDKDSQDRDIKTAQGYWKQYKGS